MVSDVTPISLDALWSIEGLVALGTLVLALATLALAGVTRAVAARAKAAIEAGVRPVLINIPPGQFLTPAEVLVLPFGRDEAGIRSVTDRARVYTDDMSDWLFVSLPFRNSGAGIAFLGESRFEWPQADRSWPGDPTMTALPPGEIARVGFAIERADENAPTQASLLSEAAFSVTVSYTDLAGNIWSSFFDIERIPQHDLEVKTVVVRHVGRTTEVGSSHLWQNR